jgi:hypothetical protein
MKDTSFFANYEAKKAKLEAKMEEWESLNP